MREYGVVGHARPSVQYRNGRQEGKGERDDGDLRACGVPFRRGEILGRVDEHAADASSVTGVKERASSVSFDAFSSFSGVCGRPGVPGPKWTGLRSELIV